MVLMGAGIGKSPEICQQSKKTGIKERKIMRYFLLFAVCSIFMTIPLGCGGPSLTQSIVFENSMKNDFDRENLPEQSASNIKVYTEIPQRNYYVLNFFYTTYSYQKNSFSYKKIEKKNHLSKLRKRAGKFGANGIIVIFSDQAHDVGGVAAHDLYGGYVSYSDNMSVEYVQSYAIYCE